MEVISLFVLGGGILLLGILNFMGNIQSIHGYNRTRITEETRVSYGRAMGLGSIIIGASLILTAVLLLIFKNELCYIATLAGCVVGLAFLIYGQIKYNKGIF